MSSAKQRYPHLLSPIDIGPKTLKNRAVISGHSMRLGDESGIGDRYRNYLVERARGGAALVGIESAPILPSSQNHFSTLELYRSGVVAGLERTAEEVHAAGALLSILLWHSGHNVTHHGSIVPLAPSPIPSPTYREVPKQASLADIREIVAGYGVAAERCARAGIDVLEIQTATDYLLGSFLSPTLNRRTDAYGGSLQNRLRIVVEVLEAVREKAGSAVAVGVRTSAAHLVPGDPSDYGLDESITAMAALAERGLIDYVSVMTGSQWSIAITIPSMTTPRPLLADQAAAFKAALPVPVTVAGRIRLPHEAEAMLAQGQTDLVAMARTWIAEPEWLNKIELGQEARIRPCMTCNQACLGFMVRNLPGSCVINPRAGREYEVPRAESTRAPKRIAIIGAGPAGLEAARVAAERGHQVTVYEQQACLGGDMRLAAEAPQRAEMLPALAWWASELQRLGVVIHLNTKVEAAPADVDEVIWAIGSESAASAVWRLRPHLHAGIPGSEGLAHGREVLRGERQVSGHVLVIDEESGWSAISLVETLANRVDVRAVTVTTVERLLGEPDVLYTLEFAEVAVRLKNLGVKVHTETLIAQIDGQTVVTLGADELGPFDSIVLSTGTLPRPTPPNDHAIGDCITPRGFWAATNDALRLALTL